MLLFSEDRPKKTMGDISLNRSPEHDVVSMSLKKVNIV